ncbi:hypothetical protein BDZ45DRAFT_694333 [Acephala macrosclerotiorum]|nr:hypothetical protein BDZ45DRAFT_694333 [Acephala macrosclerotiorum]
MPTKSQRAERRTKKAPVKAKPQEEEDINRLPEDIDSDEDDSINNIRNTNFVTGSSKATSTASTEGKGSPKPTVKDKVSRFHENGSYKGTSRPPPRSTKGNRTPWSSASVNSPKRSLEEEESAKLGAGMQDGFGFTKTAKKQKIKKFGGSSQPHISSSQRSARGKSKLNKDSPKPSFVRPEGLSDSPERSSTPQTYKRYQLDDTPKSTSRSTDEFKHVSPLKEEKVEEKEHIPAYRSFELSDIELSDDEPSTDPTNKLPPNRQDPENESAGLPPSTQIPKFVAYELDSSLLETGEDIVGKHKAGLSVPTTYDDDLDLTMTQRGRCPMCNADVDPAELRKYGTMNIRMQEKFCRAHRMKTAKETWKDEEYPKINWDKLDKRISKHHSLIKEFIEGKDSYYRQQMEEKVNAGKDRSLMKMTTNLTPGYYGARGLRAISENIMQQFTRLLKKRMVEDKLMSARGFTPYVQSVLVPEVASRLIMKDMKVSLERAREILTESIEVGELLNEEVRDVVAKTVDDSEEETDED